MIGLCVLLVLMAQVYLAEANDHVFNWHGDDANRPDCKSNAHVCTSIMKYPDGSEVDEGPYCKCPGCSSEWKTDDYKSLSWAHFERPDKIIQYKFCVPIIPERVCEADDLAVTIRTSTGNGALTYTSPGVRVPDTCTNCWAGGATPPTSTITRRVSGCTSTSVESRYAKNTDTPCAKIYIDPHNKQPGSQEPLTVGYNFLCSCKAGYKCPDKDEEEENPKNETDFRGTYIPRYCEALH